MPGGTRGRNGNALQARPHAKRKRLAGGSTSPTYQYKRGNTNPAHKLAKLIATSIPPITIGAKRDSNAAPVAKDTVATRATAPAGRTLSFWKRPDYDRRELATRSAVAPVANANAYVSTSGVASVRAPVASLRAESPARTLSLSPGVSRKGNVVALRYETARYTS